MLLAATARRLLISGGAERRKEIVIAGWIATPGRSGTMEVRTPILRGVRRGREYLVPDDEELAHPGLSGRGALLAGPGEIREEIQRFAFAGVLQVIESDTTYDAILQRIRALSALASDEEHPVYRAIRAGAPQVDVVVRAIGLLARGLSRTFGDDELLGTFPVEMYPERLAQATSLDVPLRRPGVEVDLSVVNLPAIEGGE